MLFTVTQTTFCFIFLPFELFRHSIAECDKSALVHRKTQITKAAVKNKYFIFSNFKIKCVKMKKKINKKRKLVKLGKNLFSYFTSFD